MYKISNLCSVIYDIHIHSYSHIWTYPNFDVVFCRMYWLLLLLFLRCSACDVMVYNGLHWRSAYFSYKINALLVKTEALLTSAFCTFLLSLSNKVQVAEERMQSMQCSSFKKNKCLGPHQVATVACNTHCLYQRLQWHYQYYYKPSHSYKCDSSDYSKPPKLWEWLRRQLVVIWKVHWMTKQLLLCSFLN